MNNKKNVLIVFVIMLICGGVSALGLTKTISAQIKVKELSNFPFTMAEEVSRKDSVASAGVDIVVNSNFKKSTDGWHGGFADYPDKDKQIYKLKFEHRTLPKEITNKEKAVYLSGVNRSDDLFMFVKKKLDKKARLKPNTTYSVTFNFDVATNAGKNEMGVGGAPGESVYVKVGATKQEPIAIMDKRNFYTMNIDKGNQSIEGKDAYMIGNLAKNTAKYGKYELKSFDNNKRPFIVKTDKKAQLWFFIGTDSGYESETSIYIPRIKVTLKEVKIL